MSTLNTLNTIAAVSTDTDASIATIATYRIPAQNWFALNQRLEKASRRAVRIGCAVPKLTILHEESVKVRSDDSFKPDWFQVYYRVAIESSPILVNGWTFVASIDLSDMVEGQKGIVNRVPNTLENVPIPAKYRETKGYCDHCETLRYRKRVYILFNETTNEWKQVGSSCLGHFFDMDVTSIVTGMEFYFDVVAMMGEYSGADTTGNYRDNRDANVDILGILKFTAFVIERHGWLSRSKAKEQNPYGNCKPATADIVERCLTGDRDKFFVNVKADYKAISQEKSDMFDNQVKAAVEWIQALAIDADNSISDYMLNLQSLCGREYMNMRHLGTVCSLLSTHARAMEDKIKKDQVATSKHLGSVKDKVSLPVKIVSIRHFDNSFGGTTTFLSMRDADGNSILWKASNCPDVTQGNSYVITGTVKAHNEFRGNKQTELTRCKIKS